MPVSLSRRCISYRSKLEKPIESYYLLDLSERETAVALVSALVHWSHDCIGLETGCGRYCPPNFGSQAAAAAVPLAEEPAIDWPATALWCYYCGHHHLHGVFETSSDGPRSLRMRCPECSCRFGFDIVNSNGLVELTNCIRFNPRSSEPCAN